MARIQLSNPRICILLLAVLATAGCATRPFEAGVPEQQDFIGRGVTQEIEQLKVTAAVPTAEETEALTGLDLYGSGIQPVWLRVANGQDRPVRVALRSIEDEYFSPMEVAWGASQAL